MKITIKNLQNKLPVRQTKIKNLVLKVIKKEGAGRTGWINLCFVDNRRIKKFNAKFLKNNSATDVLAFNLGKGKSIILADIMISTDIAITHAAKFKTTPDYELSLYVVHGILHILGFDDKTSAGAKLMRKKENQYVY